VNRWLAPWVAALRIARRQALRAKGRTALSAVMMGLPLALMAAVAVLLASSSPSEATRVEVALGPTAQAIVQRAPGCSPPVAQVPNSTSGGWCGAAPGTDASNAAPTAELTDTEVEVLLHALVPGGEIVAQWHGEALLDAPGEREVPRSTRTVDASGELAGTVLVLSGEAPRGPGEVGLGLPLATSLGVKVGDAIDVVVEESPVTARVTALTSAAESQLVAAPGTFPLTSATASWFVLGETPVTWDDVVALNEAGLTVLSRDVLAHPPSRDAVPYYRYTSHWPSETTQVAVQVGLVAALAVLEVVLLVGPAFAVGARRQSRSLALVAATGGTRRDLRRIVLAGGVVIGLGASVLAVALGVLGAAVAVLWPRRDPYVAFPNLVVPPWLAALVLAGTLVAVLAAWLPARSAARVDVVAALAGRRSEARPRAVVGVLGLAVAALGVPLAVHGGRTGSLVLATTGSVAIVLGLVAASGLVIGATGVLARRAGVASRIALRDLSRQRRRTAPAVAAILGAIAAATAGAVFTAAEAQQYDASWQPEVDEGIVMVRLSPYGDGHLGTPETAAAVTVAIQQVDPGARLATLGVALPAEPPGPLAWWGLYPAPDESQVCPWYLGEDTSAQEQAEYADDPRCAEAGSSLGTWSNSTLRASTGPLSGLLVDDGTALALLAGDGAARAAADLAAGKVVVSGSTSLWRDGTVRLTIQDEASRSEPVATLPGALTTSELSIFSDTIAPPSAIAQITGLELRVTPHAVLAAPSRPWTAEQRARLTTAVDAIDEQAVVRVETRPERDVSLEVLVLVGAAGLLALAATWIASGLAAVESRADLATLAAVGAAPRVRRRVAGLQSGFLTLTGVAPGILGGLAVGWALVAASAALGTDHADPRWQMVVPWPVLAAALLGLPLLAGGTTALFTPARLPLTRRPTE